jgi:ubiquinone biosynthesis protein UbiJ
MPVDIPSLRGKVDYDVEIGIRNLATAINQLEGAVSTAAVRQMQTDLATVRNGLDALTQRLDRLYGACQTAGII